MDVADLKNEIGDQKCTKATVTHDEKIMVWGCFTAHGVGCFYLAVGNMRKEQHISILENHMYLSIM